jgi:hypothetical protein
MRLGTAWLVAVLVLSGCTSLDPARFATAEIGAGRPTWRGLPIEDGQVIVIENDGALPFMLKLLVQRFEPYVHAGLIVFDDGVPQVYEAWAIYHLRLSGRPTRDPGGGIRRVSLDSFLRRAGTIAIHDPPAGVDRVKSVAYARAQLAARTRFDEFFDARDTRTLYCSEFVARALEAGGAGAFAGVRVTDNRSVRVGLDWFEVSAPTLIVAGELLAGTQRQALLDRRRAPAEVASRLERRRELHRRFTADQRLGNVLEWNGVRAAFRPSIRAYLDAPVGIEDARTLADRMLGPFGIAGSDTVASQREPSSAR